MWAVTSFGPPKSLAFTPRAGDHNGIEKFYPPYNASTSHSKLLQLTNIKSFLFGCPILHKRLFTCCCGQRRSQLELRRDQLGPHPLAQFSPAALLSAHGQAAKRQPCFVPPSFGAVNGFPSLNDRLREFAATLIHRTLNCAPALFVFSLLNLQYRS